MIYWMKCSSRKMNDGKEKKRETNKNPQEKLLLKNKIKYLPHQLYRLITSLQTSFLFHISLVSKNFQRKVLC